jgi:uncharacterized protein (DUF2132 family)
MHDTHSTGNKKMTENNPEEQPNNPLHGIKLQEILEYLVEKLGWEELGERINIRCFNYDPSIKSSLTFLRKTPWAREKVEELYLQVKQTSRFNRKSGK